MFILIFLVWIIFNGYFTLEIALFGIAVSCAVYIFACKVFGFSVKKDIALMKISPFVIEYLFVLFIEIIKANISTVRLILSSRYENEPALVTFSTELKSKIARVVLANSITLTPGTITVNLNDDRFTVHCLDKTFADGLSTSIFVKLLERMERVYGE